MVLLVTPKSIRKQVSARPQEVSLQHMIKLINEHRERGFEPSFRRLEISNILVSPLQLRIKDPLE